MLKDEDLLVQISQFRVIRNFTINQQKLAEKIFRQILKKKIWISSQLFEELDEIHFFKFKS